MVKPGDRHLRRQLLRFTLSMLAHYPALQTYRNQLLQRGKRKITANIAVARKLCGLLYALASQERPVDLDPAGVSADAHHLPQAGAAVAASAKHRAGRLIRWSASRAS